MIYYLRGCSEGYKRANPIDIITTEQRRVPVVQDGEDGMMEWDVGINKNGSVYLMADLESE